jgi:hypothetical protein
MNIQSAHKDGGGGKEEREKGTQKEEDDWDLFFLILGEDIEALSFLFFFSRNEKENGGKFNRLLAPEGCVRVCV